MRSRTSSPFVLALYWLGIQSVWGATLISLNRVDRTRAATHFIAYGRLATIGALVVAGCKSAWASGRTGAPQGSRRIEFCRRRHRWFSFSIRLVMVALTIAYRLQAALNLDRTVPSVIPISWNARYGVASSWMAALQSFGSAVGEVAASFIAAHVCWRSFSALLW
jgi:hypothetical protein